MPNNKFFHNLFSFPVGWQIICWQIIFGINIRRNQLMSLLWKNSAFDYLVYFKLLLTLQFFFFFQMPSIFPGLLSVSFPLVYSLVEFFSSSFDVENHSRLVGHIIKCNGRALIMFVDQDLGWTSDTLSKIWVQHLDLKSCSQSSSLMTTRNIPPLWMAELSRY